MAHKPALIISVSSGPNGVYPVSELRSYSAKNNGLLYIPDHVIIRNVKDLLNKNIEGDWKKKDLWIRGRKNFSLQNLELYTKHMKRLREGTNFDFNNYPFGM